eukprot:TRINITY_DN20186_c0_g1_i1.p1 TRINITY_DN20186_c0_g1~~TRINITY_DN20186_c0_g1_i1.p1  ORF type:complete len:752 (-),score=198.40 TRINITY_DN20186_c0_g1_i1:81-2336(-)
MAPSRNGRAERDRFRTHDGALDVSAAAACSAVQEAEEEKSQVQKESALDSFGSGEFIVHNTFIECVDHSSEKHGSRRRTRSLGDCDDVGSFRGDQSGFERSPSTADAASDADAPASGSLGAVPPFPAAAVSAVAPPSSAAYPSASAPAPVSLLPLLLPAAALPPASRAALPTLLSALSPGGHASVSPVCCRADSATPSTHVGLTPMPFGVAPWGSPASLGEAVSFEPVPPGSPSPTSSSPASFSPPSRRNSNAGNAGPYLVMGAAACPDGGAAADASANASGGFGGQHQGVQSSVARVVSALHAVAKGAGEAEGGSYLGQDAQLLSLLSQVRAQASLLDTPALVMRTVWSLGKIGVWNADVKAIILQICGISKPLLPRFSPVEVSNVIWGLARICCTAGVDGGSAQKLKVLITAALGESLKRLERFHAQGLANMLWSVAKVDLRGADVEEFGAACAARIKASLLDISPQGLANSVWAAARLRLPPGAASGLCIAAARMVVSVADLLRGFQAQELSMMVWAFAKIFGRMREGQSPQEVRDFGVAVAVEARPRLVEFAPQGLSNIAWAFATLGLLHLEAPRAFVVNSLRWSAPCVADFPPQAVANLCWALARLGDSPQQRDTREVVSNFAECAQIGTQSLLNIALSAARMGVDANALALMVSGISDALAARAERLNDIDARQWNEVQRACGRAAAGGGGGRACVGGASPLSSGGGGSRNGGGGRRGGGNRRGGAGARENRDRQREDRSAPALA